MTYATSIRSYPAILGGTVAAGIAWATITRGLGFTELTLEHVQAAGLIGLSVLAGHLAGHARLTSHRMAACALVVASFLGSFLTVYNGMGSRAEVRDVKVASASLSENERARIQADLDKTTRLVAEAESWSANECRSGNGAKCQGVNFVLNQRRASQSALQGQLKTVGPVATPEPKAAQVALLAGLAGYSEKSVHSIASALEPVAAPLFFELLAILLFMFGLDHRHSIAKPVLISDTRQTSFFNEETGETDPTPPRGRKSNVVTFRHPAIEAIEQSGGAISNRTLAHLMQCSEGEASKRWQEVRDQLVIGRAGKELRLSLRA